MTCGILYKFTLLNQSIIRSSREIGHNSFLKNPISVWLVGLERRVGGLPQDEISDLGDLKLHRYNRFNIKLPEGKKKYAFKDHCTKDHTSTVKGKSSPERYVWLVFSFEFWVSSLTYVFAGQHKYIVLYLFGSCLLMHVQEGWHFRTTRTHTRRTCNAKLPLLEASTTVPQQLQVIQEAMSSQVSGLAKKSVL